MNQEDSEQNEVDGMKNEEDSTGKAMQEAKFMSFFVFCSV